MWSTSTAGTLERAPIPWERPSVAGPGAGFTTGEPWLPLPDQAEELSVAAQEADAASTLHLARRITALRTSIPTLQSGGQTTLDTGSNILAWLREDEAASYLVAVNFGAEPSDAELPLGLPPAAGLVLSTDPDRAGVGQPGVLPIGLADLRLAAGEGVLIELRPAT